MDRQEAFTQIVRGLRQQGDYAYDNGCLFLTGDGRRCAIGQLMKDWKPEEVAYWDELGNQFCNYDEDYKAEFMINIGLEDTEENRDFLSIMQQIHDDDARFQQYFEVTLDSYREYAASHNLIYPEE